MWTCPQTRSAQSCGYDAVGWGVSLPHERAGAPDAGGPYVTGDFLCSQPGGCHFGPGTVRSCQLSSRMRSLVIPAA